MNAEILVCCCCLMCSRSRVKQVQERRPWTKNWPKLVQIEFTTRCQSTIGTRSIGLRAGIFESSINDLFEKRLSCRPRIRVRDSPILSGRMQRPRAHARSSAGPPPAPTLVWAFSHLVLRPVSGTTFLLLERRPAYVRLVLVGPGLMTDLPCGRIPTHSAAELGRRAALLTVSPHTT
jgi:hypothetical protein